MTMSPPQPVTPELLWATLQTLERQVQILKNQMRQLIGPQVGSHSPDYEGILACLENYSELELKEFQERLDLFIWDTLYGDKRR